MNRRDMIISLGLTPLLPYEVTVLQGKATVSGGAASLFIDPLGRPLSPTSVAGVHRRHRRRAIRNPGPGPL